MPTKFHSLYGRKFGLDEDTGDLMGPGASNTVVMGVRAPNNKLATVTAVSVTLTAADYAGKFIKLSRAAGVVVNLPAAAGTGAEYKFFIPTSLSGTTKIKVANASDIISGHVQVDASLASNAPVSFTTGSTADTVSLNGTTTGGKKGDYFEYQDVATNLWHVEGFIQSTGTSATPFVASV